MTGLNQRPKWMREPIRLEVGKIYIFKDRSSSGLEKDHVYAAKILAFSDNKQAVLLHYHESGYQRKMIWADIHKLKPIDTVSDYYGKNQ